VELSEDISTDRKEGELINEEINKGTEEEKDDLDIPTFLRKQRKRMRFL